MVELMVVIGIMGIMMLISVPLFNRFARGQDLKDSGRIFQQVFRQARWEAITRRERIRIVFTKDALGIYSEKDGYGEDFEPIFLPKGVTYKYNFGEKKRLSPPDDFPLPEKISDTQTGGAFPGKIEFLIDGSINFGTPLQDRPQPRVEEIRLFDPNREINQRVPRDVLTDFILFRRGDTKVCFVDVDPNSGRVLFRVLEAERKSEE